MDSQCVITRRVVVAPGAFAPGHLGELTRLVPFEMVDAALAATGTVQSRVRRLPSRVVVYLLLAGGLFAEMGWQQVWRRLTAGLGGGGGEWAVVPSAGSLAQARRRVGTAPLRWLFDLLRGPAPGTAAVPGTRWKGLLVCALDGTTMTAPDSPANLTAFTKHQCNNGGSGYPLIRLLVLVACGTRTVIDAVFGPTTCGETTYGPRLVRSIGAGMIVLADRGLATTGLFTAIAQTGAHVLARVKDDRRLPVLSRCGDGSYLSVLGGVAVRVIECQITIATATGPRTSAYRLATSLTDTHRHPAADLVRLYHQRWEIETAYLEIKSTILGGRILRARTPAGIAQEIYALLVTYQVLRLAMADATSTKPGTDPDRASFTIALQTARDLVIQAAGVIEGITDPVGVIGHHILTGLMPDRRTRTSPRAIKRAISKYNARGVVHRTSYKATISIDIITPPDP